MPPERQACRPCPVFHPPPGKSSGHPKSSAFLHQRTTLDFPRHPGLPPPSSHHRKGYFQPPGAPKPQDASLLPIPPHSTAGRAPHLQTSLGPTDISPSRRAASLLTQAWDLPLRAKSTSCFETPTRQWIPLGLGKHKAAERAKVGRSSWFRKPGPRHVWAPRKEPKPQITPCHPHLWPHTPEAGLRASALPPKRVVS